MQRFWLKSVIGCLVLFLAAFGAFGQLVPEFSLDDNPSPPGPWGPGAPPMPPLQSAEDEFGLGLPGAAAGFVGPSPSLLPPPGPFWDSDVLFPGPVLSMWFAPPPPEPVNPSYVDAYSTNHDPRISPARFPMIWLRFSVDRATGGLQPADASWLQAAINEQPGDIFQGTAMFTHPGFFIPLANPGWIFGGPLPTAGTGIGTINVLIYDHFFNFGLQPPPPCPPITPGTHDNVDGFNEIPGPMINFGTYYALHPASAFLMPPPPPPNVISAADIYYSPPGALPSLVWPPFAFAWQVGLDTFGFNTDSIDALVVWDRGMRGICEPGLDYALFSLAPGSATLAVIGLPEDAGAVFLTDFQGFFYTYVWSFDIGVGPFPIPPLPGIPQPDVNVDALEVAIDPPAQVPDPAVD